MQFSHVKQIGENVVCACVYITYDHGIVCGVRDLERGMREICVFQYVRDGGGFSIPRHVYIQYNYGTITNKQLNELTNILELVSFLPPIVFITPDPHNSN